MIFSLLILACCLALALVLMSSMRIKKEGLTVSDQAERQHFKRSVEDVQRQHGQDQATMNVIDDQTTAGVVFTKCGFGKQVDMSVDAAVGAVNKALSVNGFKVLTDTDVVKTLNMQKMPTYRMLAAYHTALAGKVLNIEPSAGLILCNIVIRQDLSDAVYVELSDPSVVTGLAKFTSLNEVGSDMKTQLTRVLQTI